MTTDGLMYVERLERGTPRSPVRRVGAHDPARRHGGWATAGDRRGRVARRAGTTAARPSGADIILSNGKVVTVDERFTIAQAVAIEGDRIVRVGTDQRGHRAWPGPSTRRIDLRGRTVIPGLIDNHMHLVRAGTTWQSGGAAGRRRLAEAGARPAARAGEDDARRRVDLHAWWLDGRSVRRRQPRRFSREELDQVAPDHPVLLQASYYAPT